MCYFTDIIKERVETGIGADYDNPSGITLGLTEPEVPRNFELSLIVLVGTWKEEGKKVQKDTHMKKLFILQCLYFCDIWFRNLHEVKTYIFISQRIFVGQHWRHVDEAVK